jgi:hypothetical protein
MLIIFGVKDKATTTETGTFHCPVCQSSQRFERKTMKRYFSLFFIPLIPLGGGPGSVVQCQNCGTQLPPDITRRG